MLPSSLLSTSVMSVDKMNYNQLVYASAIANGYGFFVPFSSIVPEEIAELNRISVVATTKDFSIEPEVEQLVPIWTAYTADGSVMASDYDRKSAILKVFIESRIGNSVRLPQYIISSTNTQEGE